ncbi:nucleoside hydrolase [Stipitochalara longipes BDJ]|nr:nucleoside hydrolase [Stipitochalara longipes BDJ]
MASGKIPVWLDCDPGHDDAFAILLAAYHPNLTLLGISTVHGNSSLLHTTYNATSILTAIGRPQIPVFPGASSGLVRPAVHADAIHGESGLDGTSLLPIPAVPHLKEPAVDAIATALLATPENTTWLVATGALTNIAHLFTNYPDVASHIKGLSIMGGSVGNRFTAAPLGTVDARERIGNWSQWAEFNILVDPEAADFLFQHPVLNKKTTLIPLDVTHLVLATKDVQSLLLNGKDGKQKTTLRIMLVELLLFFAKTYAHVFGITEGPPLHDPLAVAAVLDGIVGVEIPFYDFKDERKMERYAVHVVTEGSHEDAQAGAETGRTIVKLLPEGEEGVKIPRGLDIARFWRVLEDSLERADEVNKAKELS